jgi:hypothetical protein
MTIRSSILLLLIAGIVGAFIGRAMPDDAPDAGDAPGSQAVPIAFSAPSVAMPTDQSCKAERVELASTKTQLAICKAFNTDDYPEAIPSGVPPTDPQRMARDGREIRRNRKRLDSYTEAVIVQHFDGRTGVYKPDEWPIDGDGIIIARKLPSGDMAWYGGPDAGPRSDPAAFRVPPAPEIEELIIERAPDGTIMLNGEPADNAVQRMFGGKVRPEQEEAP